MGRSSWNPRRGLLPRARAPRRHASSNLDSLSSLLRLRPQGRLLELWLQHADCSTPAIEAEVVITASGEVFMTRGWGEIARGCRARGALTIHLEYDGALVMFFKVFDANGRRLECWPGGSGQGPAMVQARPADRSLDSSTSDGSAGGPSDPNEAFATPETSDDSYEPTSQRRSRSRAGSLGRRRL